MRLIQSTIPVAEHPTPGRAGLPIHRFFFQWLRELILTVPERFVPVEVSADYTARAWDCLLVDASGGAFEITLPENPQPRTQIAFSEAGGSGNNVTITANTGYTIMGGASAVYNTANAGFLLILAGSDWRRIG